MRFLLRTLGFLCLAAAFAAAVVDGTRSIAGKQFMPFGLGETIAWLRPDWTGRLGQLIDRNGIEGGHAVLSALLAIPTSAAVGLLGLLLLSCGRRRRPAIGTSGRR